MKKLAIVAALAITSLSAVCWAAPLATVTANNYDSDKPIFYLTSGTKAPAPAGGESFWVQIMGGPAGGAQALANTAGKTDNKWEITDPGFFDAGVITIPGVTASSPADLTIQAWKGNASSTYAAATEKGEIKIPGQATGSWDPAAVPPAAPTGPSITIPGNILVGPSGAIPEPSTLALGLLGAGLLLIRRRK